MTDTSQPDNSGQICSQCNNPVTPGKNFCESCGAKIDDISRCPQCGTPVSKGTKFCESCGATLDEPMAAKPSVVPLAVPEQVFVSGKNQDISTPHHPPQSAKVPDSKKPIPTMTLAIIGIVIIIILATGAYVVVLPMLSGTGTSQNSGNPPGSEIPTVSISSSQTSGSSLLTGTLTPEPTDKVPPPLEVNFQAERDPISGIVTVTFTGGAGQNGVREVVSRLTRSDGQVVTKAFTLPRIGTSETLQGTKMTDRVEVIAYYYNGNQFTVLDQIFEYKKR